MTLRPEPSVLWREGMLLCPQHLQSFTREIDARIQLGDRVGEVGSFGLVSFEVDATALARDLFTVTACEAVFHDGTRLRVPEVADLPPRAFAEFFQASTLDVWLGLPVARPGVPQLGEGSERAWRYQAQVQEISDENSADSQRPIDFRRLQGRLFFGNEDRSGFECLPIARLVRVGRPVAHSELSPEWIAPLLACGASPVLMKELKSLAEAIRNQARDLAARLPATASLSSVEKGADLAGFVKLQAVNHSLALIEQAAGLPQLHPWAAYGTLVQIVGSLAIFGSERTMPVLPVYDHEKLDECMRAVIARVRELCVAEVTVPYDAIAFKADPTKEGFFEAELPAEWIDTRSRIFLGVEVGQPPETVIEHVANRVKLVGAKDVDRLLTGVVPGIELSFERQPPLAFPKRADLHFFRIGTEGASREQWAQIESTKKLTLLTFVSEIGEVRFHLYCELRK